MYKIPDYIELICKYYKISTYELRKKTRKYDYAMRRQLASKLIHRDNLYEFKDSNNQWGKFTSEQVAKALNVKGCDVRIMGKRFENIIELYPDDKYVKDYLKLKEKIAGIEPAEHICTCSECGHKHTAIC